MTNNTILVCLPTYHGPLSWLTRAVDSLKKQTWTDFHCWIVKDGCDKCARWGDRYDKKPLLECNDCQKRLHFMRKITKLDGRFFCAVLPCNFGGCGWAARNHALLNTTHNIIAYLDDDNWWEPNHLRTCFNCLVNKKVDLVFSGSKVFDEKGKLVGGRLDHNRRPPDWKKGIYCRTNRETVDTSEIMHHRRLLKYGGWRYTRACDWELLNRWMMNGATWSYTGKYTVNYMQRTSGISSSRDNTKRIPFNFL